MILLKTRNTFFIFLAVSALLILAGCHRRPANTPESNRGKVRSETGIASFYADKFEGRKTASGELYRGNKYTCAHRTLPFGTVVTVTNPSSRRSVKLRVNDRGPWARGRMLDVSKAAARELDLIRPGTARVTIRYQL